MLCGGVWDNKSLTQDNDEILSPMPGFFVLQDIFSRSVKRIVPGLMEKLEQVRVRVRFRLRVYWRSSRKLTTP